MMGRSSSTWRRSTNAGASGISPRATCGAFTALSPLRRTLPTSFQGCTVATNAPTWRHCRSKSGWSSQFGSCRSPLWFDAGEESAWRLPAPTPKPSRGYRPKAYPPSRSPGDQAACHRSSFLCCRKPGDPHRLHRPSRSSRSPKEGIRHIFPASCGCCSPP